MSEIPPSAPPVEAAPKAPPAAPPAAPATAPDPAPATAPKTLLGADAPTGGKVSEPPKEGEKVPAIEPEVAAKVVPEKYELKLPEGSLIAAERLEKISQIAKEKGLSNDEAQALLQTEHEAVDTYAKRQSQEFLAVQGRWLDETKADPEVGGAKLAESVAYAEAAVAKFGDPELKEALNATGLGNHKHLVRMLARIGKAMAPDTLKRPSGNPPGEKKSHAERLYPNHKQ